MKKEIITMRVTRPDGKEYEYDFDTMEDAWEFTDYLPCGWAWEIYKGNEIVEKGKV